MKAIHWVLLLALGGAGAWFTLGDHSDPPEGDAISSQGSSEPQAPTRVGGEIREISADDPAPPLYVKAKTPAKLDPRGASSDQVSSALEPKTGGPQVKLERGVVNPDAITYYRKAGLLGASREALAVLSAQPELWQSVEGTGGLGFRDVGGGLTLGFEVNDRGAISGAVVEVEGGGAGARLMTIEMWMTGMENPWNLYWERERPGPVAGRIPTPNGPELHYYCDMTAMDPSGSLMEPSRCHFMLNQPTPEELAYRQIEGAAPLQPAEARP